LIEHLPDEVGVTTLHRAPPREPVEHFVEISTDSRLLKIIGQSTIQVASWHHQAIRSPGKGLRVVARAPDNTIEAVELEDNPRLIAVQWHPELTGAHDPLQQKLFETLVTSARPD